MPNAKVLSEKQAIVAALAERLKGASAGVFVDYKGITVDEDTKLRTELRQNDVEYSVVKNTLTRFALKDAGLEAMSDLLNGTTSLATSTADPIVPYIGGKPYNAFEIPMFTGRLANGGLEVIFTCRNAQIPVGDETLDHKAVYKGTILL